MLLFVNDVGASAQSATVPLGAIKYWSNVTNTLEPGAKSEIFILTLLGSLPGVPKAKTGVPLTFIVLGLIYPPRSLVPISNSIASVVNPPLLVIVHVCGTYPLKQAAIGVFAFTSNCGASATLIFTICFALPFTLDRSHFTEHP